MDFAEFIVREAFSQRIRDVWVKNADALRKDAQKERARSQRFWDLLRNL